jgi:solute carrier family 25 protein 33/36
MVSSISTNPIWVVKTRLQLDRERRPTSLGSVVRSIWRESGLRGFYLGLTASIYGISETVVHFVVYEYLKARLVERRGGEPGPSLFLGLMGCGAASKAGATCLAYPHGEYGYGQLATLHILHQSCMQLQMSGLAPFVTESYIPA